MQIFRFLILIPILLVSLSTKAQNLDWVFSLGNAGQDAINALVVDDSGYVYTTGIYNHTVDFDPDSSSSQIAPNFGNNDMFYAVYDTDGNLVLRRRFGASCQEYANTISRDPWGNVLISGTFNGSTDLDPGPGVVAPLVPIGNPLPLLIGHFIVKLDPQGDLIWWGHWISGNNSMQVVSAHSDSTGNTILALNISHSDLSPYDTLDFDPGPSWYADSINGNGKEIAIMKLDTGGNMVWVKRYYNGGTNNARDMFLDDQDNILVTGIFSSGLDFDLGPDTVILPFYGGQTDAFVLKLDANGNYIWSNPLAGLHGEYPSSVVADHQGDVYVTGQFADSLRIPPWAGFNGVASNGMDDVFFAKYTSGGSLVWLKSIGGAADEYANVIRVDKLGNPYIVGKFDDTVDFDPGPSTYPVVSYPLLGWNSTFLLKLDALGDFKWVNTTEGLTGTSYHAMDVDGFGNVYDGGSLSGMADFDPGPDTLILTSVGTLDIYLRKTHQCLPYDQVNQIGSTLTAQFGMATYQWLDCNANMAPIVGQTGQTFSPSVNGDYAVEITQNGCVDTSQCYSITNVGIADSPGQRPLSLYPNPASERLTLTGDFSDILEYNIVDAQGRKVSSGKLSGEGSVDVSSLQRGMYFLTLRSSSTHAELRFIKQ